MKAPRTPKGQTATKRNPAMKNVHSKNEAASEILGCTISNLAVVMYAIGMAVMAVFAVTALITSSTTAFYIGATAATFGALPMLFEFISEALKGKIKE